MLREVGIKAASLLAARDAPVAPSIAESSVITSAGSRVLIAATVGIAYYAGAQIGFLLKLPPGTPSALWPPNAILMATLLLLRPGDWWIALLAAVPGHLAVELRAGWPMPLVFALYVTNCSEALIGVLGVRLLSDAPGRFDSLPRMAVYIAAGGLLAPIISSFADAAVVSTFRADSYWDVWRARTSANILTDLTLVPALIAVVRDGRRWFSTALPRVHVEAVILAVASMLVVGVTFASPEATVTVPRTFGTPLGFLLPILLWAGVRFGPSGASLVLVEIALVANWGSLNSRGPLQSLPPSDRVLALQLGLSVVAVPILCLAALIEERWRTEAELGERLAFEQVLSRMSAALVLASGRGIEDAAAIWLGKLAVFLKVDCAWLIKRGPDDQPLLASSWVAPGVPVMSSIDPRRDLGGVVRRLDEEDAVLVENVDDLPPAERAPLRRLGVRGLFCVPIGAAGRVLGGLVFASVGTPRIWSDVLRARLQLVSEVFASALARQAADEALRAGEAMKSSILASLSSGVAVVDRSGTIVAVNERWTSLAHDQHEIVTGEVGVGANYLQLSLHAAVQGAPHAGAVHAGLEGVLGRSRSNFTLEYQTDGPAGERWAVLSVVPLSGAQGGAVITHTDITERRRAEMEAERSRQELAHFARVSAMGELTASLAHQLNQPLTGILANAQAAQRMLHGTGARPARAAQHPRRHRRRRPPRRRRDSAAPRSGAQGAVRARAARHEHHARTGRAPGEQRRRDSERDDRTRPHARYGDRAGESRGAAAGHPQPAPQRARRGEPQRGAPDHGAHAADAGRHRGERRGLGARPGGRHRGKDLRAVLHLEAGRDGDGPFSGALDHRCAPGPNLRATPRPCRVVVAFELPAAGGRAV